MRDQQVDQVDQTAHALHAELHLPMDHAQEACDGRNPYNGHKLFIVVQRDTPTCEDCDCETPVHHVDVVPTRLSAAAPALLAACEEAKSLIEQLHATWLNPKERSKTMDAVDVFWMHWLQPVIEEAKRRDR